MFQHNKFIRPNNLTQYENVLDSDESDIDDEYNRTIEPMSKPIIKYKHVKHSIIVNSIDRDWTNTTDTPFNFRVKFSPESEQSVSYPLYENNPTIPATQSQSNSGSRGNNNTSGWYDSSGTFRMAYDPSQPLGNEIGQEYITIKEPQYAPISTEYRNIISIKLSNAILPNHKKTIDYTTTTNYLSNYQYINVRIDELENTLEGTNTGLRKSFAVLHPKKQDDAQNTSFIEYKNVNEWDSKINLNTLPFMTIQCYDPLNKLISNFNDTVNIEFIYYVHTDTDDTQTEKIAIRTSEFFDTNEFPVGSRIYIKDYLYRDDTTVYGNSLNEFINRDTGHVIIGTDVSDSDLYLKNIIHIPKPASFNTLTGNIDNEAWYTLLKLSGFTNDPSTISDDETGKIINLNMQTTFFFEITTQEPDNIIPIDVI